jgi:adenosine deaminase
VQPNFFKVLILGFDFAISVMQTWEGLERTAYELVEDSSREGVMHLHAIFAPCLHRQAGLSYDEVIEAVIAGLEKGKRDFGVSWELSLGIYRGFYTRKYPEHPMETVQAAERFAHKHPRQIAIDVVGAEFEMPLDHFKAEFEALKDSGVIFRPHAGEMPGYGFNIETALDWGITRMGHGIHASEALIQRLKDSKATLEVSPISNLKCLCLGAEADLGKHPIAKLLRAGVKITLCTDDRTVMDIDNVSQMLALEEALPGFALFRGNQVTGLPFILARNGFDAIADRSVYLQYRRDLMPWMIQINRLMEIIAG